MSEEEDKEDNKEEEDKEDNNKEVCCILFAKSCYTPVFHARGRLLPIEMVGLPVTHVVDAVGAVLRALSRYASRIARHANAARPRPPPDLSSGERRCGYRRRRAGTLTRQAHHLHARASHASPCIPILD